VSRNAITAAAATGQCPSVNTQHLTVSLSMVCRGPFSQQSQSPVHSRHTSASHD